MASVLANLPQLSPKELVQIRDRANFLLGLTSEANPALKRSDHDWLLEGLTQELRRQGLWLKGHPLPKAMFPGDYALKAEFVRAHLLKGAGKVKFESVQLRALGALGVSVLFSYLKKIRIPIGPKTALINIDKVPVALEESFPGYWDSGLLGSCIATGGAVSRYEPKAVARRERSDTRPRS